MADEKNISLTVEETMQTHESAGQEPETSVGETPAVTAEPDTLAAEPEGEGTAPPISKRQANEDAVLKDRQRRAKNVERLIRERERQEQLEANQKFYSGIAALQEAQRRRRVMKGIVGAVATKSLADTGSAMDTAVMLVVMLDNRYRVEIPFMEFFRDNPLDMSTVDMNSETGRQIYNRRQRQMAEKMYGAEVPFIITHVEVDGPNDYSIAGSRREALLLLEQRNFYPIRDMEPRIAVGDFYEAEIVSVGNYNLYLNVGGVDASIPLRDMTYRYVRNLAEYYKVGQKVLVEIKSITRNREGHIVLALSAKSLELKMAKKRQDAGMIEKGTLTIGIITNIRMSTTKKNAVVIHAYLPYYKMPAIVRGLDPSTLDFQPQAGDEIRLSITGFSEVGFVLASCHGFHDASTLLRRD